MDRELAFHSQHAHVDRFGLGTHRPIRPMNESDRAPRPMINATPGPGAVTRCYKATCAICQRVEIVDAHDKENDAHPVLRENGWKQTRKLTDDDRRHWICPKHHEPGSYKVYRDKEADRPVELGPGDVYGLG